MTKSICEKVCAYIESTNVCRGCGRTDFEIQEWFYCSDERKKEIAKTARTRSKQLRSEGKL